MLKMPWKIIYTLLKILLEMRNGRQSLLKMIKKKLKTNFKVPNNGSKVTQKQVLNNMLNIKSKLKMSLILSCKDCIKKIHKLQENKCPEVCLEDSQEELISQEALIKEVKDLKLMKLIELFYC